MAAFEPEQARPCEIVRKVGGRVLPTRWDMRPDAKPGNSTTVVLKDAVFDRPLDDEIFSQRNLQKR